MTYTPQPLIPSNDIATQLGITPNQLSKLRMDGTGPAFIKVGRRVMYHPDDVAQWIQDSRRTSTNDKEAA